MQLYFLEDFEKHDRDFVAIFFNMLSLKRIASTVIKAHIYIKDNR